MADVQGGECLLWIRLGTRISLQMMASLFCDIGECAAVLCRLLEAVQANENLSSVQP